MSAVRESWERIHRWLQTHAPKILTNLNPPASADKIAAVEKGVGMAMPEDWRELYRVHDGMNSVGNLGSLFCAMQFEPLEDALRELQGSKASQEMSELTVADPAIRKANIYNPKWIVLARDYGDTMLYVDMDPSERGTAGQVIFVDYAYDTAILLAPSLGRFLTDFAHDLETNRYFLNQEAASDGDEFLSCVPEIDVINWYKSPRWKHLSK